MWVSESLDVPLTPRNATLCLKMLDCGKSAKGAPSPCLEVALTSSEQAERAARAKGGGHSTASCIPQTRGFSKADPWGPQGYMRIMFGASKDWII